MSIIKEYTADIKVYDYSEKSILLVTPAEWGRPNAESLKSFAKFGTRFSIEGRNVPGWIIPKSRQMEALAKLDSLIGSGSSPSATRNESQNRGARVQTQKTPAIEFDEEDEAPPRRRLLERSPMSEEKMTKTINEPWWEVVDKLKNMITPGLCILSRDTGNSTTYYISGPEESVDAEIRKLLAKYPGDGYSSCVDFVASWGTRKVAVWSCMRSCD